MMESGFVNHYGLALKTGMKFGPKQQPERHVAPSPGKANEGDWHASFAN